MENQLNKSHAYNAKTVTGIALLGLGLLILANHISIIFFPHWLFSWPMILIAFGLYTGSKSDFKKSNWILFTGLGILFLLPNIIPSLGIGALWPLILIAIGFQMVMRRKQNGWTMRSGNEYHNSDKNI